MLTTTKKKKKKKKKKTSKTQNPFSSKKVPFESLRRTTRERKYVVEELSVITSVLSQAARGGVGGGESSGGDNSDPAAAAAELLSKLTGRLRKLKRSLEEASRLEELDAARVRARIEHVATGGGTGAVPERGSLVPWTRARFDRMVADDLARRGRGRAARALRDAVAAEEQGGEGGGGEGGGGPRGGLDLLVDWDVYAEAEPALRALETPPPSSSTPAAADSFGRAEPALEWCRKHAARLKKLRSPLSFRLRLKQFVELALRGGSRGGDENDTAAAASASLPPGSPFSSSCSAALAHAKRHLAPQALGDPERLSDLQRAMLLLVVLGGSGGSGGGNRKCKEESAALDLLGGGAAVRSRYGDLLSGEAGWRSLAALMRSEVARVHEMAPRSQLSLQVTAGLIALKPPPGAVFDPLSSSSSSSPATIPAAAKEEQGSRLPACSSSSRNDPLSSAPLAALASSLPHARRLHSQLVCGLTGREMGDADPPAALPCGATFSESGLRAIAGPDGCVECPLHGGEREGRTPLSQLRRVFVS